MHRWHSRHPSSTYRFVWSHLRRLHLCNKAYLDALSSLIKLITQVGNHTQIRLVPLSTKDKMSHVEGWITKVRKTTVYSLRGVMEIPRYSPHPTTNALIDCIYHSQTPCRRAPIPCRFTPPGIQGCMVSLPRSRSGVGWLSSEWSPLCRDHARAAL